MAKIYFTVDVNTPFYDVLYINPHGQIVKADIKASWAESSRQTFEREHPQAIYLNKGKWEERVRRMENEKLKLAVWKEWAI